MAALTANPILRSSSIDFAGAFDVQSLGQLRA
jgi:hypothetical protein